MITELQEARDEMVNQGLHVFGWKQDEYDGFFGESTGMLAPDTALNWALDRIRNHEVYDCDPEGCNHIVDCTKPLDRDTRTWILVDEVLFHVDGDDAEEMYAGPPCPGGEDCVC